MHDPDETRAAAAPDYAGLLCARICHDLISPAGAIGNGVELLREIGPGPVGPELELIAGSAEALSASLQFIRIAFGAAGESDAQGLPALQRVAHGWFAHQRPDLDWPEASGELARGEARLLLNLLQIAAAALPRGGRVAVSQHAPGALRVAAEGPAVATPEGAHAWIAGETAAAPPPGPRDVHWLAAERHAAACGARLSLEREEGRLTLAADAA